MLEQPEYDVWNAPDETLEELYPETQKLVNRLRRRRWYYRTVAYLPIFGWGLILLYAVYRDGLFGAEAQPHNWIWVALIVLFMAYTAWCLVAPGLVRRMIGYFLSAIVAFVGGLGSCLLGSLLALADHTGAPDAGAAIHPAAFFLAGVLGSFLSLLAMIHILLLIIVSARLRTLTGMSTFRALKAARGEAISEVKVILAKVPGLRPSAPSTGESTAAAPPADPNALPAPPPTDTADPNAPNAPDTLAPPRPPQEPPPSAAP